MRTFNFFLTQILNVPLFSIFYPDTYKYGRVMRKGVINSQQYFLFRKGYYRVGDV